MFADLPPSSSVTRLIDCGRERADPPADLGRAGEGDLGHVRVPDEPLADDAARADDDVQHALGQPRLDRDPLELERGQRRQLRRLQHDRVAGGERGRDLPGGDRAAGSSTARSGRRRRAARGRSCRRRPRRGSCRRAAARARRRSTGTCRRPCRSRRARRAIGLPALRASSRASSSARASTASAIRAAAARGHRARPRATPGTRPWRARPPRRLPRRRACGSSARTSSVAGSTTLEQVSVPVAIRATSRAIKRAAEMV